ncbi:FISUMP domain-containing protein [Limibacter armeniacum]|uniref:FISUMP domain-containing protein n=1 Tax=Limibacter armeniacum TaxID=466084 RepID=UPI002FE69BBB
MKRCYKLLYSILIAQVLLLGSCKDNQEPVYLNPNAGQSYIDIENEGYVVELNAVPVEDGQQGTWKIYIGNNGSFEDIHNPRSKFYGEPGESYQLGWEVSERGEYEASVITVSFKPLNPIILSSMNEETLLNNVSCQLEAEAPRFGATGHWEVIKGADGRVENQDNPIATFIGKDESKYTVSWVLTYGSKEVATEMTFYTDILKAYAGEDRLDIKTPKENTEKYFTLEGYLPAGANGKWSIIDGVGAKLYSENNPASLFKGLPDSVYTLTWTVNLDEFSSVDTVNVRFRGKWGVWVDERDQQAYRFTEINGLEWMSDNFNHATNPGTGSFYYGHVERGVVQDGIPLETEEDRKKYGRLYTYETVVNEAPEGWRLPTGAEWEDLINTMGGPFYAKEKLISEGESGVDLGLSGYLEISSSSDPAYRNVFRGQDYEAFYWTSDFSESNGYGLALFLSANSEEMGPAVIPFYYYALPVRYVREVQ